MRPGITEATIERIAESALDEIHGGIEMECPVCSKFCDGHPNKAPKVGLRDIHLLADFAIEVLHERRFK